MFPIIAKEALNATVTRMDVYAPLIAKKAQPGQFIILRTDEDGERIPLTVAATDPDKGAVTIIFQIVGATTQRLNAMRPGEVLRDFVGPLGKPTQLEGVRRAAVIGGGVGCAIAWPVARRLCELGATVHAVTGSRNQELIILEKEFRACADRLTVVTDDGSNGRRGLVTDALEEWLASGERYDLVIAIGPLIMMKFVAKLTKEYGVRTIVSMNPIMIDGTGMCGGCRLTVGGKVQFACVDGPDFDGHLVDFDEAMRRSAMYKPFEGARREEACRLLRMEANESAQPVSK